MKFGLAALLTAALLGAVNATETRIGPTTIDIAEGQALETLADMQEFDRVVGPATDHRNCKRRHSESALAPECGDRSGSGQPAGRTAYVIPHLFWNRNVCYHLPSIHFKRIRLFHGAGGEKAVMFKNYTLGNGFHCGLKSRRKEQRLADCPSYRAVKSSPGLVS